MIQTQCIHVCSTTLLVKYRSLSVIKLNSFLLILNRLCNKSISVSHLRRLGDFKANSNQLKFDDIDIICIALFTVAERKDDEKGFQ